MTEKQYRIFRVSSTVLAIAWPFLFGWKVGVSFLIAAIILSILLVFWDDYHEQSITEIQGFVDCSEKSG